MAEKSYFFNSTPDDPRWYEAQHFNNYFESVFRNGILTHSLVDELRVKIVEQTMSVKILPGRALINGHLYINTSEIIKQIETSDVTNERVDRIVLRLNLKQEERNVRVHVKKGENDGIAPELERTDFVYELSLAQILVRKDTVQLLEDDLKDERLVEELCGLVQVLGDLPTTKFQEQWDDFMSSVEGEGYATLKMLSEVKQSLEEHTLDSSIHKTTSEIRQNASETLRVEVVDSLSSVAEALDGQIVLVEEDGIPKFKGFTGDKWV